MPLIWHAGTGRKKKKKSIMTEVRSVLIWIRNGMYAEGLSWNFGNDRNVHWSAHFSKII